MGADHSKWSEFEDGEFEGIRVIEVPRSGLSAFAALSVLEIL
jgi:hypothetical protein